VLIKITDFGIAKILDAQGVTSTGQVLGSPAHMAPEQIEGGDVDVRTDVFALGVLMYECMVGHLPFEGKNPAQVLRRVIEGSYERAETERPTVGGRFSRILDGALANDPKDRVENPAALAALIKEELEALGIEDSRREVALYFADPDAYRQQLVQRLVPRLVARGEEARKHKRIQDAGWDFNRAHALAPDDVAILRRMTQLGGSADRQKLMRRVGMVAAASIGLGTIAFFTARAYRDRDVELAPSDDIGPDATQADPRLEMLPPRMRARMNEAIASSATGSARVRTPIPRSSAGGSAGPAPDVSNKDPVSITFFVKPRGAQLEVDGAVIDHMTKQLIAPGSHTARLIPPKGGCCEPGQVSRSFEVKPQVGDGTDKPQSLSISAQFRPAKVRLSGPSGGKAFCGPHTLAVGQTESITMTDASWAGQCKFIGGEGDPRSGFGEFFAGVTTELSWPPPEKAPSP
jgi:serine/threonine-protein kinase